MSCHFQISISASEGQVDPEGGSFFTVRVRRDGIQWQPDSTPFLEAYCEGESIPVIMEQVNVEDVRKFSIHGPSGLLDEIDPIQLGWCLQQLPELFKELMRMDRVDLLSFNSTRFEAKDWGLFLREQLAMGRLLSQYETLDKQTISSPARKSISRF